MKFFLFSRARFRESIACAALFAGSVTLHIMWISHLLIVRVPRMQEFFTLSEKIGPVSGLYAKSLSSFVILFFLSVWFWRGKDCAHHRKPLVHFFLVSTFSFFLMTLPFIYGFVITSE
jgi:hypothetical protein